MSRLHAITILIIASCHECFDPVGSNITYHMLRFLFFFVGFFNIFLYFEYYRRRGFGQIELLRNVVAACGSSFKEGRQRLRLVAVSKMNRIPRCTRSSDDVQQLSQTFPALEADLVTHIFSFLSIEDFPTLFQVCRLWRDCARYPRQKAWENLSHETFQQLGSAKFCGCKLVRAVKNFGSSLRKLDLSGCEPCYRCPGTASCTLVRRFAAEPQSAKALLLKVRSDVALEDSPALEQVAKSCQLLHHLNLKGLHSPAWILKTTRASAAHLVSLNLIHCEITDRVLIDASNSDGFLLPNLKSLQLSQNPLKGAFLGPLLEACPLLEELHVPPCVQSAYIAASIARTPRPLRVNRQNEEPLEPSLDISCGRCNVPLFTKVSSYLRNPPSQPHIGSEYCIRQDIRSEIDFANLVQLAHPGQLTCMNRCHYDPARFQFRYLVDCGTGNIQLYGHDAAVAIGTRSVRLAIAHPSGTDPNLF